MSKTLKHVISLLLAAVLMTTSVTVIAFAANDGVVLSGSAGDNVTWTLTNDGVLTVSGVGAVEDETEEEIDEDGYASITTLDSIGMTVDRYFMEQTEGLSGAETARFRFELVREIALEEGVTAIPSYEFSGMYPAKVTLPSTLETMEYDAFDLLFAEEIVVNSVKLSEFDIYVPAYESGAEPF